MALPQCPKAWKYLALIDPDPQQFYNSDNKYEKISMELICLNKKAGYLKPVGARGLYNKSLTFTVQIVKLLTI